MVLSLLLWTCVPQAGAQEIGSENYAGFEGQSVSKVDVSAQPTIDIEGLKSLIKQKAGDPFSMQAIRDTVTALQDTKRFESVQVSITPEASGLDILFILQPTSYVGILDFPGALKAFSYTQLLQAVDIPEQAPYREDLAGQGSQSLMHFFQINGYFDATVTTEEHRDDAHRIVSIRFNCQLNRVARVGKINIQGASGEESQDLLRALRSFWARLKGASLKPGTKYSQQRINKSLDYIRTRLRGQDRLAPTVRFISPSYHAESGRADLNIQVDAGPHVSVRVEGAKASKGTIRRLIPIYEENSVDQDLVDEGQRNLLSYFQSKGFFDAKIEAHMDRNEDAINVTYNVNRGAKHRVEQVNFDGNHYFGDKQLRPLVSVRKGLSVFGHVFSHGQYSEDHIRKSVAALTAAYHDAGFADAKITPNTTDYEPRIDVTFQISEGEQTKVNTLTFENNRTNPKQTPLSLTPGKPYSPSLLQQDRNRILASYQDRGYENAQFRSNVTPAAGNPHLVDVTYSVDEGTQQIVNQVVILGTKKTRPKLIEEITDSKVKDGKPLSFGNVLASEGDLYSLGIFDWASIKPLSPSVNNESQEKEDVLIKVHESPRNSIDFGVGFEVIPRSGNIPVGTVALPGLPPIGVGSTFTASQTSYWGPRVSFQFTRHNLFGSAETGTFGVVYSRLDQRGTLTYSTPHFRGSSWSSLFSLSAERSSEISIYTAEVQRASAQVEKPLDTRHTRKLTLRYSYQHTLLTNITIPDLVLPQDQNVRLSSFSAQYIRDTRDKPLDAHRGIYQTLSLEVSPTALGSSANFVRFVGQLSFYKPVKPWLTWANNFRLGIAKPFAGTDVPLSERFFSGGADSIRGFPINGAGPQRPVSVCSNPSDTRTCTLISVPVGGDMLAIVNSEARFPIPLKTGLGGVVFYDGGNVYANNSLRQFADNFTHTVGIGIRYQTPVGPVRIDIGRRLTSVPGVNATQYYVTLGQAF